MATDHKTVADEIADRNPRSFEARWRMRVHRIADQPLWNHPLARVVAVVGAALLFALVVSVPLDLTGQLLFSAGSFGAALLLSRTPGRLTTLAMIVLSISASSRYMYWRVTDTVGFTNWVDACFGFGLLLSLTPCVFPMIPILSGIIVGAGRAGRGVSHARGFTLSLGYVLGMAVTYAAAGVAAGFSGTLLSASLQNAWVLGGFALIFVALSLSMFGFYELQLPSFMQSRLSEEATHLKGGSLAAVTLMGALSALIVGPCVAAPLAGALLYIAQTKDALLGGAALFAMGLGMGAPLLAVGDDVEAGALLVADGEQGSVVLRLFEQVVAERAERVEMEFGVGIGFGKVNRVLRAAKPIVVAAMQ